MTQEEKSLVVAQVEAATARIIAAVESGAVLSDIVPLDVLFEREARITRDEITSAIASTLNPRARQPHRGRRSAPKPQDQSELP